MVDLVQEKLRTNSIEQYRKKLVLRLQNVQVMISRLETFN